MWPRLQRPCRSRRAHYRDFPRDLKPSRIADFMAHVNGILVEIVAPLILLFSTNMYVTVAAALFMVCFHPFSISTFPLAVPLESNVVFAYTTVFLFLGSRAGRATPSPTCPRCGCSR